MSSNFRSWFKKTKESAYHFTNDGAVEFSLHILIEEEHDLFTAHCLEFDIVADGSTLEQAQQDIMDVCKEHIVYCFDNKQLENLVDFAPEKYWRQFYDCNNKVSESLLPKSYPRFMKEVNFAQCQTYA